MVSAKVWKENSAPSKYALMSKLRAGHFSCDPLNMLWDTNMSFSHAIRDVVSSRTWPGAKPAVRGLRLGRCKHCLRHQLAATRDHSLKRTNMGTLINLANMRETFA